MLVEQAKDRGPGTDLDVVRVGADGEQPERPAIAE